VNLPDGRKIINASATLPDNKIDGKLIKQIEKAHELDEYHFSKDDQSTKALDKIIENFADAQAFDANYKLVTEKDGEKIKMQEIERSKSQERDDR